MWRNGWLGRPLLVLAEDDGVYQALTGSHRLAAARVVGLSNIPAIILSEDVAQKVRGSIFYPKAPPLLAQDLFGIGESWIGRFILMDQWIGNRARPWAKPTLEYLEALGHADMIPIISVRKWPCPE